MKNKNKNGLPAKIIIVILTVAFIGQIGMLVEVVHRAFKPYTYESSSMHYAIGDQSYPELVRMMKVNQVHKVNPDDEMKYIYAVANYFEKASYYRIYLQNDETQKAQETLVQMEEYIQEMGALQDEVKKINTYLGVDVGF